MLAQANKAVADLNGQLDASEQTKLTLYAYVERRERQNYQL